MGKPAPNTDLADLLGLATETTNSTGAADFTPIEVQAAPTPEDVPTADFGAEPELTETAEVGDAEPVNVVNPEDARKAAFRYINFIDNLQKPLLVKAYRASILHPGDEERLSAYELEKSKRGKYSVSDAISEDDALYYSIQRANEFMALCDKAAFTEDEKDSLAGPLAEVLEKHSHLQLSPEMALLLAVAMVMLPRVAPLIPQFRKGFTL